MGCPFERYADDAIVHCTSRRQAEDVLVRIAARMREVGLRLHPDKRGSSTAKAVSAGQSKSTPRSPSSGTPSGHRGRAPRTAGALPASCQRSAPTRGAEGQSAELRAMRIHRRTDLTLDDLARWLNRIVAGWINYYGRFYRSAMYPSCGASTPT
jgi:RNA-directed DNA polymerase